MSAFIDTAIIGAGPYGLSIASHLQALGIDFRIFGVPMQAWKQQMPAGMMLKSDGAASNLADPEDSLTLKAFSAQQGLDYDDHKKPVPLQHFIDYGMAFQRRFVPQLEEKRLVSLEKSSQGFSLRFEDGEIVSARRVVVAVGIAPFKHVPGFLQPLPPDSVTHSSAYGNVDRLAGKRVAVLGAGASALDLAALLHRRGAEVSVVARQKDIAFHNPPVELSFLRRLRWPNSGIGAGWQLRIFADAPQMFHALPEKKRLHLARTLLGPSAGWFMKDHILGKVPLLTGLTPQGASQRNGQVHLLARDTDGRQREIVADHVIAATGYRIDLGRLDFLQESVRAPLRQIERTPILSSHFESSVPGLYFVGAASMNSFGPVVRFVFGARYTAGRVARHLTASRVKQRVAVPVSAAS